MAGRRSRNRLWIHTLVSAITVLSLILHIVTCTDVGQSDNATLALGRNRPPPTERRFGRSGGVCPRNWQRTSSSGQPFLASGSPDVASGSRSGLCLWVNERQTTWREAMATCRRQSGFLVKLETLLELDGGEELLQHVRHRGFDSMWTGLHYSRGVILWDELRPTMVKPYFGSTKPFGYKRRHWNFAEQSFLRGPRTCGLLHVQEGGASVASQEVIRSESEIMQASSKGVATSAGGAMDLSNLGSFLGHLVPSQSSSDQAATPSQRERRSVLPEAPGDPFAPHPTVAGRGTSSLGVGHHQHLDAEDSPAANPTQEADLEHLQQFLANQGFQEKYVESLGEVVSGNTGVEAQAMGTTESTTTTTDQSNLEDDDHHLVVTKRSVSLPPTPVPPPKQPATLTTPHPQTPEPKFSQQNSAQGTSLPTLTQPQGSATVAPTQTGGRAQPTPVQNLDDWLKQLLQAASGSQSSATSDKLFQQSAPSQDSSDQVLGVLPAPSEVTTPKSTDSSGMAVSSLENAQQSGVEDLSLEGDRASTAVAPLAGHGAEVPNADLTADEATRGDGPIAGDGDSQILSRGEPAPGGMNFTTGKFSVPASLPGSASPGGNSSTHANADNSMVKENGLGAPNPSPLTEDIDQLLNNDLVQDVLDDSQEVVDTVPSLELTTKLPSVSDEGDGSASRANLTEQQSKVHNSREMFDFQSVENMTNSISKNDGDLDPLPKLGQLPGTLEPLFVESAQIFDPASNSTDSSEEVTSKENNSTSDSLSLGDSLSVQVDLGMPSLSGSESEQGSVPLESLVGSELSDDGDSSETLSRESEGLTSGSAFTNTMELEDCEEEHPSVCMTEAIEELTLVGHCDRGWYGHRLLDRCYKPVGYKLNEFEARQTCLQYGARLVMADTDFYGNVTDILHEYFQQARGFESKIWVDTTLNMAVRVDGACWILQDGSLKTASCSRRMSFICQKEPYFHGFPPGAVPDERTADTFVHNVTSFQSQTLVCPLQLLAADDVVIWFKDGRPIQELEEMEGLMNGQVPHSLELDLSILRRIGPGGDRLPQPAMLQGVYWCEVWRRAPVLHRVTSHKIFLRFSDVLKLHASILTKPVNFLHAAIFNSMGLVTGLPATMERHLATINKNITHHLREVSPHVRDVISFVQSISPVHRRAEFVTYISLATEDLSREDRHDLSELYVSALQDNLEAHKAEIQETWGLRMPLHQALDVSMTDQCPAAVLEDKRTRRRVKFESTNVNTRALSTEICNGIYAGSAWCRGDLHTGAYWDNIRVTGSCYDMNTELFTSESDDEDGGSSDTDRGRGPKGKGGGRFNDMNFVFHKPPHPALLALDEVEVEPGNVMDVTERLSELLEEVEGDLSDSDVAAIAQVMDRIVAIHGSPTEVSKELLETLNQVMDAPPKALRQAEWQNRALSRLVKDMEQFADKVDMGKELKVRHVTPNVAMELWSLEDAGEDVVIGMGVTGVAGGETGETEPLSDPKLVTIKDRKWADQNLADFDIAIELPESLVRNTIRYSDSALRLSMFVYRTSNLFLASNGIEASERGNDPMTPPGEVNSAVISASLGGRQIRDLEDKIRLVFKPLTIPEDDEGWDVHCVFWDDGSDSDDSSSSSSSSSDNESVTRLGYWSSQGCVYNGTWNGRQVCLCDHLTNFAVLLDFYGEREAIPSVHETSLSIITLVGLSLSIFGLAMTIITFLAFKKLRQGRAQQTLFNMAIALLSFQAVFLLGIKQTAIWPVCLVVAALLHYLILVAFAWMLIEAVLQYLTFVKVLGTYISRYTLKTVVPAWGIPLIPVTAVLITDYNLYLGRSDYCWMDLQAFYFAFAVPVGVIIVFNLVMFLVILVSLLTRPKGLRSNQASGKARETNIKAAFTIFILLGLTWMFGYLAIEDARIPFQYAFTVLSSMQGFLIFVLMVVRRRQVREHWRQICCLGSSKQTRAQKKLSPTSSSSTSSNHSVSNSRTLPSFINHAYNGGDISLRLPPPPPYPPSPPTVKQMPPLSVYSEVDI